ncbi:HlyD family type I secretion periplasmic adaptor subunit [Amphritea balenae]|uniref:Membrane fusion protein (MFP) family protein n=1 Tax=Amphritea balenae TaxID=452629 RepID=A0A3P1SX05_9GAMM|nr:HlyD family type I secretion periplasmic adaptor subunit [Amphritea balenae]RRD01670.1 HlyD family type I secretion periplasmic adaptor subunit [Amphritea balenae]GGK55136.1 hypothetical protein GCM10007941_01470 [Amphritea balenae]
MQQQLQQSELDMLMAEALLSDTPETAFKLSPSHNSDDFRATLLVLQDTLNKHRATLAAIKSEISQNQATLNSSKISETRFRNAIPIIREQLLANQSLLKKSVVSRNDVNNLRLQMFDYEAALDSAIEARKQASASIRMLEAKQTETQASYHQSASSLLQQSLRSIAALKQDIKKEQQIYNHSKLYAPVTGKVHQLQVHTVGAVVNSAQKLLTIIPDNMPLEIEAFIQNKDIGFVKTGQEAEVKFEAFPFTRYGITHGKLKTLSHDAIIHESYGPVYKATFELNKQTLEIEGKEIQLSPGLVASVEIKTGRRQLLDFFISPLLRYKDEAIRER